MRYLSFLLLFLVSSCFLMPLGAPHGHTYKSIDKDVSISIGVFCTPHNKRFMFNTAKSKSNIEICSKTIKETCSKMTVFGTENDNIFMEKSVRISDRKYHKLFKNDTLVLTVNDTIKYRFIAFE